MFLFLVKINKFKCEQENEGRTFRKAEFPQVLYNFGKKVMLGIKARVRILSPHVFLKDMEIDFLFLKFESAASCFLKKP